ncbi:UDP-N-acetylmuramoyl-L-alanine--D-glutamate ligase [Moheibacter sediminis]|uniref:UDP-N-acetylmuramoylalanine--D-glutamate ligase n=1 Tax=Moheibacter sediminis TaxID=1434700 RepID=A0A1W2CRB8_9FLAO|nr:UDP-N-acetylmuramoyl-L-alanine--D-glutamate ligase [Moheibacter sediminis]SMC87805.1 UDP-N-acetylmuramoylalanine--D-glutamate ligase [Moheibacter sediminis]
MKERLVILGGGESGVGAALLGKKHGFEVFLSDKGNLKDEYKNTLIENSIEFEEGFHTEEKILNADLVVKSPGIPKKADLILQLNSKNIPVVSEIEFASRYTEAKIIAVTGSNGKTTTTSLVYHILTQAGLNVGLGGNIGKSFAQLVVDDVYDYYVLEISSFQLDDVATFKPYIAILLNITPDHLDQYDYKLELYARSKFKITENQTHEDYFVYNFDDDTTVELLKEINTNAKKIPYSMNTEMQDGTYADDSNVHVNYPYELKLSISEFSLRGRHNVANTMAAATAANILKIRKDTIKRSLSDFTAVEHRLETVLKIGGIEFINDSKATNVNATYYALESMNTQTVWIVGGTDKGNDYSDLIPLVKKKVRAIVCLGLDNSKILSAFEGLVDNIVETKSMQDAVRAAYMLGKKGDTVLLSPACASFDLFENYEDRGNQFKKEIKNL